MREIFSKEASMRLTIKWAVPIVAVIFLIIGATWSEQTPIARGAPNAQSTPDPTTIAAFTKAGCVGCHTIPGVPNAVGLVGPNLSKIGAEAAGRKSGVSAEAYIRESILTPEAFTAPACPPSNGACPSGVMPPNFSERLSAKEIDLIVANLLMLKGDAVSAAPAYVLTPLAITRPPETKNTPFTKPPKTFENEAEVMLGKYLF
ncbi:MAG: c-type cytochrome, partial [Chloroflexi bacterium]|nr:c-type cytochrome [Chloroflexota bacterium]